MNLIFILLQLPSALMVLYLDVLSVAALCWHRAPPSAVPSRRFALLVPAHNEELLLPRLLASVSGLSYPRDLCDVHVVADNCDDGTAVVARSGGASVYERRDEEFQGKGYALRWLLKHIQETEHLYDAFLILDADSIVSSDFLDVMNRHLARGDQAIQSYYGVLNPGDSWTSALRFAALALFNDLRPRGRDTLRLSAGLRGNGMCFSADIVNRFGWESFTLAEDVELHLKLVEAGVRVSYAPAATVYAEMPVSLRQAQTQNVRWERGRLQMIQTFGPRLLARGLRRRDPVVLDAVAEQLVPPLSVLTTMTVLAFLLTWLLRLSGPRRVASILLGGQVGYILTGLRLVHAGPRIYLALLRAPFYIVWKLWIYAVAASRLQDNRWVRTERSAR